MNRISILMILGVFLLPFAAADEDDLRSGVLVTHYVADLACFFGGYAYSAYSPGIVPLDVDPN